MPLRLTKRKAAKPIPIEGEVLHFTVLVALPFECQLVVAREAVLYLREPVTFPLVHPGQPKVIRKEDVAKLKLKTREDEVANLNTAKMLRLTHRLFKAAIDARLVKSFDLRHKREVPAVIGWYDELPIMSARIELYHMFARDYNLASEWHDARQPHLCLAFREFLAWRLRSNE